ncbi:helix-turn-helix domain-containing protein [Dawidia soli]|uniref:AraC family transcriptional regulator n=1 Tax=Dawidia soli TaxID=2782352 RepID=A0AAP2GCW9_9BACT|nr:AraC family transcriptional regulator [Dawidia soli]MBT1686779.1 AraC family transcriptional regulator [Dawidia soli]
MEADLHTLYRSDFYQVIDFRCRCTSCTTTKPEYADSFCISFVRKGNFLYNVFRRSMDSYTGCVIVTKPGTERTITHTHSIPDECTIFQFTDNFFRALLEYHGGLRFFTDNDIHSLLAKTDASLEFLHHHIIHQVITRAASTLEIDQCVLDIVREVLPRVADYTPDTRIDARLKKNHLETIEAAKAYITTHFTEDISLTALAQHCCVSPFHFSRIFKSFTSSAPHQYLLLTRLKHAEMILRNTTLPVADAAFASGFNSLEHFTKSFHQRYGLPPAKFRTATPAATVLPLF